jgi:hypothetical protein
MYTIGQSVIIVGFGTLRGKRFSGTVSRMTKTLVEVNCNKYKLKFRLSDGREQGSDYSGFKIEQQEA